ncbi:MAG: class I SAM-dependent methyltransferase [Chloroflexi bacterium]|nr:class I SAM-dependent methyltransferase [Chloroflexota bacterium]
MTSESQPRTTQEFIQQLLSPQRDGTLDMLSILSFSEISHRDRVAEIGCGPGYFTPRLAKALMDGKLYALDTDEEMLDACRQQVTAAHLGNVEVEKCGEFDFPLEEGSLDGVFLAFVVHESPDQPRFLQSIRRLLKPRGWVTVLNWHRRESENGPPLERRIDPEAMQQMVREAGFRYRNWRDLNGEQYMMTLRNP